jgi:hypothetical protein
MDFNPVIMLIATSMATGLANTSQKIISDAYDGLKKAINDHYANKSKSVVKAVERFEQNPQNSQEPLMQTLADEEADQVPEIVEAANNLKSVLEKAGVMSGDNITISGNKIVGGANSTNIQQNIGKMSGGSVIGSQTNYGDKKPGQ